MHHHKRTDTVLYIGCFLLSVAVWLSPLRARGQDAVTPLTPIYAIQGDGTATPLRSQRVNSAGMVTAVGPSGFFMQDPAGDGRADTSDGIYVFTNRAPAVALGQCVVVQNALVDEYYDKTELSKIESVAPADRCAPGAPTPVELPMLRLGQSAADVLEPLEGMVVAIPDFAGVVQGPTKRFTNGDVEVALVPDTLMPYIADGRVQQADAVETGALIFLSGVLGVPLPDASWGERIQIGNGAQAVLDYNFGKYQLILLPGAQLAHAPAPLRDDPLDLTGDDEFTVCSFNLRGMGSGADQYPLPAEYAIQLRKRAAVIAEQLQGCTIVALQETGQPKDAEALARMLEEEFGLAYSAVALPGPQTAVTEFPLTNSLLARRDGVEVLAATALQGCSPVSYDVFDPPGACPIGAYGLFDRLPLVVDLRVAGAWGEPLSVRIIDNHWKSKGGDEAVNAPRRRAQAEFVAGLAQEGLDGDPAAAVIVLGDLNDYLGSEPVETLRTATEPDLEQAYDWLPRLERYSYIFNGASQALDHLLFSPNLLAGLAEVNVMRVSADYAMPAVEDPASYRHASDHDPIMVRFRPAGATWLGGNLRYPGITVAAASDSAPIATTTTDANGDYRLWNLPTATALTLTLSGPAHLTLPGEPVVLDLRPGVNSHSAQPIHAAVQTGAAAILSTARPDAGVAP